MRIIFFGSDDFAAIHLKKLLESSHEIVACVTQPDRPKGRGMKIVESPIKEIAVARKIPLLQPETLKSAALILELQAFDADVFVVVAYGKILPENVLSIPGIFCVNVHGSLLPKYRGAAPINWAIINGDDHTGVTVMKMSSILDAGEIILQAKLAIAPDDTVVSLRLRMAQLGAVTLLEALDKINAKSHVLMRQDLAKVSYASKLTKELGHVDWKDSAVRIWNLVRGLQPWPGVSSSYHGKKFKILSAQVIDFESLLDSSGTVIAVKKEGIVVSTGNQLLLITRVQPESGKPMDARSFAAGQKLSTASRLD
jgi:methionyl-tRNA formyltransferase